MPRPHPSRRFHLEGRSAAKPNSLPHPADRALRVTWASAESIDATRDAAIGKVVLIGDARQGGRVCDIVFERESGDIIAYEVDTGDRELVFILAENLERESPCSLHFATAVNAPSADAHEFITMERFPPAVD